MPVLKILMYSELEIDNLWKKEVEIDDAQSIILQPERSSK